MVASHTELAASLDLEPFPDNRVFDICPSSIQLTDFLEQPGRVPLRPVAWSESGTLVERTPGRPLVYLTLGTAYATVDVLRAAIAGLARLPADVLVAAGPAVDVADLGDVPDHVRVRSWVSQAAVLPHVDLVVHHGGSGTMLGTFAAGKPQLVLPRGADQFTNADTVVSSGAGSQLLPAELTSDAVKVAAQALLTDEDVHAASRRLAEEIAAMPSPREVAGRLPELVGAGGDE
jgi:MGT family glycosyltransferase